MSCFIPQILQINKTKGCWPCHAHGGFLLLHSAWLRSCLGKMCSLVIFITIVIIIIVNVRIIIINNWSPGRQHRKFLKQQHRHSGTRLGHFDLDKKTQKSTGHDVILFIKKKAGTLWNMQSQGNFIVVKHIKNTVEKFKFKCITQKWFK